MSTRSFPSQYAALTAVSASGSDPFLIWHASGSTSDDKNRSMTLTEMVSYVRGQLLLNDTTLSSDSTTKAPSEHAVKTYADGIASGISWKDAVRVATTVAGTLATSFENGDTVDGVVLATGNRILIKNQSTQTANGIYVVAASGAPTRATDCDADAEVPGATCVVLEGTANTGTQWTCNNAVGSVTLGSTNITFVQTGTGVSTYVADESTLHLASNTFSVKDDGVTYAKLQNISATKRALGRNTAGAGNTEEVTASQIVDWLGTPVQGMVPIRNSSTWGIRNELFLATSAWLGTIGDSDVSLLAPSSGTDYHTELQALIDHAASVGAAIYWDGQYATSVPLTLPSNTHIVAKVGCGIIRYNPGPDIDDITRRPIFISATRTYVDGTYPVVNIVIENLTINGNAYNLVDATTKLDSGTEYGADNGLVWLQDLWFAGVDGVRLYNTRHYMGRNFATFMTNCKNVRVEDTVIDHGDAIGEDNHDGHHFTGPCYDMVIRNVKVRTRDDVVALNADEGGGAAASPVLGGAQYGPILNVVVENIFINNGVRDAQYGQRGMRVLSSSSSSPVDKLIIRNIVGSTTKCCLLIDNYPDGSNTTSGFGDVVVENFQVDLLTNSGVGGEIGTSMCHFSGPFRSLILRGFRRGESDNTNMNTMYFSPTFNAKLLHIDDFKFHDSYIDGGPVQIKFSGSADVMRLTDVANDKDATYANGTHFMDLVTGNSLKGIGRLELDGVSLTSYAIGIYHTSGYLGELTVKRIRQEYDGGYGVYYASTAMVLPLYGADSSINVVNLVAPTSVGTVVTKYGSGWSSGATAGAHYPTGSTVTPHETFDANELTFTDVLATTAATTDGANVKTWIGAMRRGRLVSEATNFPTLKTGLFGGSAYKGIRFDGTNDQLLFGPGLAMLNPITIAMLMIPRSVAAGLAQFVSALTVTSLAGWALGRDADQARWVILRDPTHYVTLLSSAAYLASGTAKFLAGTYNPFTGVANLYGAATGDSTFTLLDTDTLSGGAAEFRFGAGAFGADVQAGPGEFGQVDIGLCHMFPWDLTTTQLNTLLLAMRAAKGY